MRDRMQRQRIPLGILVALGLSGATQQGCECPLGPCLEVAPVDEPKRKTDPRDLELNACLAPQLDPDAQPCLNVARPEPPPDPPVVEDPKSLMTPDPLAKPKTDPEITACLSPSIDPPLSPCLKVAPPIDSGLHPCLDVPPVEPCLEAMPDPGVGPCLKPPAPDPPLSPCLKVRPPGKGLSADASRTDRGSPADDERTRSDVMARVLAHGSLPADVRARLLGGRSA